MLIYKRYGKQLILIILYKENISKVIEDIKIIINYNQKKYLNSTSILK